MTHTHSLDENLAVLIFTSDNPDTALIFQPNWPNGEPWGSEAEANNWALAWIESMENKNSKFLAGNSPDQPLEPRPVAQPDPNLVEEPSPESAQESANAKLLALGLTPEEIAAITGA